MEPEFVSCGGEGESFLIKQEPLFKEEVNNMESSEHPSFKEEDPFTDQDFIKKEEPDQILCQGQKLSIKQDFIKKEEPEQILWVGQQLSIKQQEPVVQIKSNDNGLAPLTSEQQQSCSVWKTLADPDSKIKTENAHVSEEAVTQGEQMKQYEKTKQYILCVQCEYFTDNLQKLTDHTLEKHPIFPSVASACSFCPYKAISGVILDKHMKIHTGENPYKCSKCEIGFRSRGGLNNHTRKFHPSVKIKPFTCKDCNFTTFTSELLREHKMRHGDIYKCNHCGYKSYKIFQLTKHMSNHPEAQPSVCTDCDFKTLNSYILEIHKKQHSSDKSHFCDLCDFKSRSKSDLTLHLRQHVSFSCAECDFSTRKVETFISHKKNHTLLDCSECDFKTVDVASLRQHEKTHTKETYACDECGYKTNVLSSLMLHKTRHPRSDLRLCPLCDFKAVGKRNLQVHLEEKHPGETLYGCLYCEYRSASVRGLEEHQESACLKRQQRVSLQKESNVRTENTENSGDTIESVNSLTFHSDHTVNLLSVTGSPIFVKSFSKSH